MKCPICGRPTRIVKTETRTDGSAVHVRLCTSLTSFAHPNAYFETIELLASAVGEMGAARIAAGMDRAKRGLRTRAEIALRRERIEAMLRRGLKPERIAAVEKVTGARVRQIRAELSD